MQDDPKENSEARRQTSARPKSGWTLGLKILLALVLAAGVFGGLYNILKETYTDRRFSRFIPGDWVNLKEEEARDAGSSLQVQEKPLLRFGVAPIVSPEKSIEMYQGLIEYVAGKIGRKPVPVYRPTYSETNDLVRYRRCDVAVVCTYPFIRGEREFGMQALVVPRVKGTTTYQSFIVVPQSSPAKSLLDLRGKRFASGDIMSTTGWLFPAMTLMKSGENPAHFFGDLVLTGSHDKSVRAVIDGFVDGAAVHGIVLDLMAAEDPSILKKIKIVEKSPPFGIPPIVAHPDLDPSLKQAIVSVLLDMHNDPIGKKILEKLQIEQYVLPEKGLFNDLRQAIGKLEGWK
jgi:phosphonate transport system substrate-binding protein